MGKYKEHRHVGLGPAPGSQRLSDLRPRGRTLSARRRKSPGLPARGQLPHPPARRPGGVGVPRALRSQASQPAVGGAIGAAPPAEVNGLGEREPMRPMHLLAPARPVPSTHQGGGFRGGRRCRGDDRRPSRHLSARSLGWRLGGLRFSALAGPACSTFWALAPGGASTSPSSSSSELTTGSTASVCSGWGPPEPKQ